jgi:hypothetical protein
MAGAGVLGGLAIQELHLQTQAGQLQRQQTTGQAFSHHRHIRHQISCHSRIAASSSQLTPTG